MHHHLIIAMLLSLHYHHYQIRDLWNYQQEAYQSQMYNLPSCHWVSKLSFRLSHLNWAVQDCSKILESYNHCNHGWDKRHIWQLHIYPVEVCRAVHTNVVEIRNSSTVNCSWMKTLVGLNFKMAEFASLQCVSSLLNLSRAEILIFGLIFDQMDLHTKNSDMSYNVWHSKLKKLRCLSKLG